VNVVVHVVDLLVAVHVYVAVAPDAIVPHQRLRIVVPAPTTVERTDGELQTRLVRREVSVREVHRLDVLLLQVFVNVHIAAVQEVVVERPARHVLLHELTHVLVGYRRQGWVLGVALNELTQGRYRMGGLVRF